MAGRSRPGRAASRTPRPTSRGCCRRRRGSTRSRPSSMARSWPSTRTGGPDFSLLQTKLGQKGVGGLIYQPFDLLYLDGRLAARRPARGSQATASKRAQAPPAGPLRDAYRRRGRGVLRGGGGQSARRHDRQAAAKPVRARAALQGLVEAQVRPEQELVIAGWTPGEGNARILVPWPWATTRTAS